MRKDLKFKDFDTIIPERRAKVHEYENRLIRNATKRIRKKTTDTRNNIVQTHEHDEEEIKRRRLH